MHHAHHRPRGGIATAVVLSCAVAVSTLAAPVAAAPAAIAASGSRPGPDRVTVDGVRLSVASPLLPPGGLIATPAGTPVQAATATSLTGPLRAVSIMAVPFGFSGPDETALGPAAAGAAPAWQQRLAATRTAAGGVPLPPPVADVFGRAASGIAYRVPLALDGTDPVPVDVAEWVVEGGDRLWILRTEQQATPTAAPTPTLAVTADSLGTPTTLHPDAEPGAAPPGGPHLRPQDSIPAGAPPLPTPPWWHGFCDEDRDPGNYQLGTTMYRDVPACGPRRVDRRGAAEPVVRIGSWGEYEWECVELVMRYMAAAGYITSAYSANGNTVVSHYDGTKLVKERNGVRGVSPQPGDVVSMAMDTTYGHSALVIANNVNSSGNGTVTLLQENWTRNGLGTLKVRNWTVQPENNYGHGVAWLHDPATHT